MPGINRRKKTETSHPDSERWQTSLTADLEKVAKQLEGSDYYNTSKRVGSLRDRKLANSKTSISFGNEKINYISDARENQSKGGTVASLEERNAQKQVLKDMKAALTTTNFMLGDEQPQYSSVARDAMAMSDNFKGYKRVVMNAEAKAAVKKSSLHFGNEHVTYSTVSNDATKHLGGGQPGDWQKKKEEIATMTASLRKHNFSFGEEKVNYVSDQTAGYGSVPLDAYSQRAKALPKIRETIEDSRSCHFSLGLDKVVYKSDTHRALETITSCPPSDIQAGMDRIKAMKTALQRTSIIIGDDEKYM